MGYLARGAFVCIGVALIARAIMAGDEGDEDEKKPAKKTAEKPADEKPKEPAK